MKSNRILNCTILFAAVAASLFAFPANRASSGQVSKAARELTEFVCKKFGMRLSKEGSEALTERVGSLVGRYGDDGAALLRKVGPEALDAVEKAGDLGPQCVKLLVRNGDKALWVVSRPKRLAIFVRHGDDAASAMMQHGEIVEGLIERWGGEAASALAKVSSRNARRVAMLGDDGLFAAAPTQSARLFTTIKKHGDEAADFIWRNKGALAVAATLVAFVDNPEPFLSGAQRLGEVGMEQVAAPIAEIAAAGFPWRLLWLAVIAAALAYGLFKMQDFRRKLFSESIANDT